MGNYTPPTSLTIHLSKIDMPELQPRAAGNAPPDKKGGGKEKPAKKDKRKEDGKKPKQTPSPPPGRFGKPPGPSSKRTPSPGHPNPPPIPHHSRPPANTQFQYLTQYNQQDPGALNTAMPPPQPPRHSSVVPDLMGWFTNR